MCPSPRLAPCGQAAQPGHAGREEALGCHQGLLCGTFTWVLPRTFGLCDIPGAGRPHFVPEGSELHQLGEPCFKEKGGGGEEQSKLRV